jgi:hypothetical protein
MCGTVMQRSLPIGIYFTNTCPVLKETDRFFNIVVGSCLDQTLHKKQQFGQLERRWLKQRNLVERTGKGGGGGGRERKREKGGVRQHGRNRRDRREHEREKTRQHERERESVCVCEGVNERGTSRHTTHSQDKHATTPHKRMSTAKEIDLLFRRG